MRAHQAGQFPLPTTPTPFVANVSTQILGVQRGVRYRLVADQDVWISVNEPAVLEEGLYLPAKVPDYFAFGMDDKEGTDLKLYVIAAFAGRIYVTPLKTIPTEG